MPVRSVNSAWKWPGTPGASAMRVRCACSAGSARATAGSAPSRLEDRSPSRAARASVEKKADAEKRLSKIAVAPVISAWKKVLSALVWKSGRVVQRMSSAPTPSRWAVLTPHQKNCACGQQTPFDGPVVPEV